MKKFSSILVGDETLVIGCGDRILSQGHTIAAVKTNNANVTAWAEEKGIVACDRLSALQETVKTIEFDWLFSLANLAMLPDELILSAKLGAINFHDALLPDMAGLNTPVWALLENAKEHGVTWHFMTDGADRGEMLLQRSFAIEANETAHSLNSKCYAAAIDSFEDLLNQIEQDALQPVSQDFSRRIYYAAKDRPRAAGVLDWSQDCETLERMMRALDFGGYWNPIGSPAIKLSDRLVPVKRSSQPVPEITGELVPGQVVRVSGVDITVAATDGMINLSSFNGATFEGLLSAGEVLPAVEAAEADHLKASAEGLNKDQNFWRERLNDLVPVEVPLANASGKGDGALVREIALEPEIDTAAVVAVLAQWARQGQEKPAIDVCYVPKVLADLSERTNGLVAPWIPLRAERVSDTSFKTAVEATQAELSLLDTKTGFANDLMLRDPQLEGQERPAIAITETDTPLPGACVTATLNDPNKIVLHFDAAQIDNAAADILAKRLGAMIARLSAAKGLSISLDELCALPAEERSLMVETWNSTHVEYDKNLTVDQAFEAQAAKTPDAVALVYQDQSWSFEELNTRANVVAHHLRAEGVGPDTAVGVCLNRSEDLLIGVLGVMKAGGAYVPLDPDHPQDRLAYMLDDSAAHVVLSNKTICDKVPQGAAKVLLLEDLTSTPDHRSNVLAEHRPSDLAYLIYTSGSTGRPKGVMVEHGNVINFFCGMDACVPLGQDAVWMAVTSLSFDISVLELLYTLSRGFKVVLSGDEHKAAVSSAPIKGGGTPIDFSLYYWGNDDGPGPKKYQLLLDGARFADENGFAAVWTPERHFHAFGGPFPNPSVTGAAVAAVTENIAVRAGSCVAPLHHPARIAEEWSVIDNLTNGRTGLAFASGWHPDDFVLRPENTPPNNRDALFESLGQVRQLWRGEEVEFPTQSGDLLPVRTLPRPVSSELECWVTTAGNPQTWRDAGTHGAHILTHLLGQSIEEVGDKIKIYQEALREAGHDPANFKVTVMLHSFIANTREEAKEIARGPMKSYLRSAAGLIKQYAWAFPAFKKPEGVTNPFQMDLSTLSEEEMEAILDFAFERYFEDSGMFGTVEDGIARAETLRRLGVSEVACLIDYGIAPETVLEGLVHLKAVMDGTNAPAEVADDDFSLAAQIVRHRATHLQCTPSMARLLVQNDEARVALGNLKHLFIGGEALPRDLLDDLKGATSATIQNMYGPTETTIWSTQTNLAEHYAGHTAPIGTPIANTQVYVLDAEQRPCPIGVPGELYIGGDGVTRGYWQRPELTADRFVENTFDTSMTNATPLYKTGDVVRWSAQGMLEYIGRDDHQVKIRGHRIEIGEIEATMAAFDGVKNAVVTARDDWPVGLRLVGYYTADKTLDPAKLRQHLQAELPQAMVPSDLMLLDRIPLTPNKKIDRKALPAPVQQKPTAAIRATAEKPGSETSQKIAAVWGQLLGLGTVQPSDNFFDLGGHSLLAVKAHREIKEALGTSKLSITDIFRFPVLGDLAQHLSESAEAPAKTAAPETEAEKGARDATMSKRRAMRAGRGRQAS